jgi:hypothetical protein
MMQRSWDRSRPFKRDVAQVVSPFKNPLAAAWQAIWNSPKNAVNAKAY